MYRERTLTYVIIILILLFAGLAWLVGIMLALRSYGLIDAATS